PPRKPKLKPIPRFPKPRPRPKPRPPPLTREQQNMVDTYLASLESARKGGPMPAIKFPDWVIEYVRETQQPKPPRRRRWRW
ncbi:unnamed protein product, partial [marine sediment metagenome]